MWTSQRRHRMRKKVVLICLKQTEIQDNFTKNTHWLNQVVVAEVETLTTTTTNQVGKIKRLWGQEIGLTSFQIY